MYTKITCTFTLLSSHEITVPGFRGGNKIVLKTPFLQVNPLGIDDTTLEIEAAAEGGYTLTITSANLSDKEHQIEFVEKVSEYISFLINREEKNPIYGNPFLQIDWFGFDAIPVQDEPENFISTLRISDSLSITSTRTLQLHKEDWCNATYNDILRFYFDGLRAEHRKSKYFHWFLILEFLENSEKYHQMFAHDTLFNKEECEVIRDAALKMSDGTKKGALNSLLSRTREFRSAKLLKMLNEIGIVSYYSNGISKEVTENVIKAITKGRNAIFHSGSDFPDAVLWNDLFPLVTLVVEQIAVKNKVID